MCCRITCGKIKFKFATSCAPGRRLVDLLWCLSASQSLASRTSSLSIRGWKSTAAIRPTAICSCRSSCCPWCATCQAISSSFNKTAHLHTGHATLCDFLCSQDLLSFLQICDRWISPILMWLITRYMVTSSKKCISHSCTALMNRRRVCWTQARFYAGARGGNCPQNPNLGRVTRPPKIFWSQAYSSYVMTLKTKDLTLTVRRTQSISMWVQKGAFGGFQDTPKCVSGRYGSSRRSSDTLVDWERIPLPYFTPLGAFGASILSPSALATRRLWRLGLGIAPPQIFSSRTAPGWTFGMAWTRASLTMQSTSGVSVFERVCGKKADICIVLRTI